MAWEAFIALTNLRLAVTVRMYGTAKTTAVTSAEHLLSACDRQVVEGDDLKTLPLRIERTSTGSSWAKDCVG